MADSSSKLRVGVVGARWGQAHIKAYQALPACFSVDAICDIDAAAAQQAATEYDIPHIFTDFAALCALAELDVISICTPSHLHTPQAIAALAANKHVIVEKPIAASLCQLDELIEAETRAAPCVMPIFQYRFGHGLQKLKFLQERNLTGRAILTTVQTAWRRRMDYYAHGRGTWETDLGGALVRLSIHAHDIVTYLLGAPCSVAAHMATRVNPIETEDTVTFSLEMADGSLCAGAVTTGSSKQTSQHRFCFSNLTAESHAEAYCNTGDPWQFTGDTPEIDAQITEALAEFVPQPEGLPGQFLRFYQSLTGDSALPVTLADARTSVELATAIYHAADTGQTVYFPLGSDHPKYADWRPQQWMQRRARSQ